MNITHTTMAPPVYRQRLGAVSRDALRLIWATPGITTSHLCVRLGLDNSDDQLSPALQGLKKHGYISGQVHPDVDGRATSWRIADAEAVRDGLEKPPRARSARCIPYVEKFDNPIEFTPGAKGRGLDLRSPASPTQPAQPQPVWRGPIALPRTLAPDFSGRVVAPPPVVRGGSLDALRLPSLRFGMRAGTEPAERLAVVEARA